jgi:hypothetical protein
MGKKFRSIFLASFLVLGVTGCNYDGGYRYPCQDPTNWEKAECKPPICEANGACPVDLVGEDIFNSGSEQTSESGATDNG